MIQSNSEQERDKTAERDQASPPIVCVSDLFWDEHWASEQQVMSRLAKRCRVLYVERPVSLFSFFTGSSDASVGRQVLRWLAGGLRANSDTLTILTPPPILPFRYNRIVNIANQWLRLQSIKHAMKKLGILRPTLWIYEPDAARVVGQLGERFSLYYCADDWAASDQWWNNPADVGVREAELASKVNLVVGTARAIVEKWRARGIQSVLVSNGADVASFQTARDPELKVPDDLERIPKPRIGYVGFVNARFDTHLYEHLADLRPEWHWIIVGPVMEKHVDVSHLRQKANVHFLGARPRASLPAYLKGFDVCAIPYVCNTLTKSVFPLKLFEYLAAGRQLVATALPELAAFAEHVRIAQTADQFARYIDLSLRQPLPPVSADFLADNSWDVKADYLWRLISAEGSAPRPCKER